MDELEGRLHDELDSVAMTVGPTPELDSRVPERVRQRMRRRSALLAGAGVVAAIALVAGVLTLMDDSPTALDTVGDPEVTVSTTDVPAGPHEASWSTTAEAPIAGRTGFVSAWTGEEMLVWGGVSFDGELLDDGAAYDPDADTWRVLPEVPSTLEGRADAVSTWTGSQWIILGGRGADGEPLFDYFVYDPSIDSWIVRSGSSVVGALATQSSAVWTGEEVVVVGVVGPPAADLVSNVFAIDPDDLSTSPRTTLPVTNPAAVSTGDAGIVVTGGGTDCEGRCIWQTDHDAATGWVRVDGFGPEPPLVWTGDVVVGRTTTYSFDAGSETLPVTADAAVVNNVWTGAYVVGASDHGPGQTEWWQLDPAVGDWAVIDLPQPPESTGRYGAQAAWTGDEVLIWGGTNCGPDSLCAPVDLRTGLRLTPAELDTPATSVPESTPDTRTPPTTGAVAPPTPPTPDPVPSTTVAPADEVFFRAGTSFGMCGGYCLADATFRTDGTVSLHLSSHSGSEVDPLTNEAALTEEASMQLTLLLQQSLDDRLEETYGCPDCADGGAAWIELGADATGEPRRSTYEFGNPPPVLANMDAITMAIIDALTTCESNEYVTISSPPTAPCTPRP